ncbi:MAG TPA: molybdenum ABC transporter ATP-binding protein [Steroidobacteraceae bacterium]|nr:molybdenum ABC transporter ATP-binding protein [Steroidobacteraceae bacterium]
MLDVDLTLRRGTFQLTARFASPTPGVIALFGPSGAGKSTLASAIAGLLTPAQGHIRLDDRVLYDGLGGVDVPVEQRRIGYVFQDTRLFPHLDVSGNLRYGAQRAPAGGRYADRDEIVVLLGLGALLGRRANQLSGGERQRVALARALLAQPRLLLLDEPLASVEVARREEVLPYLETLRDRFAIPMLYVSHQYEEVLRLASHIVLLADGGVLASGTPAELSGNARLQALLGTESVGAVLDVEVVGIDPLTGLVSVALGSGTLRFALPGAQPGAHVRLNVLARDVILATSAPHGLSVRNALAGVLTELADEGPDSVLASVAVGGARLLARITRAAVVELALRAGTPVWALVKAASLRGHAFSRGGHGGAPP